jgi:hypothetical protein
VVEQEGHGVREDFAQQPAGEVPHVARPHPLDGVAFRQLRKDGVYTVTEPAEEGAPLGGGVPLLGGVWGQELHAPAGQLLGGLRGVVVAVPDDHTGGRLGDLREHGEFVGVGRGHRETGYDPRPADPHVHTEAVEGLLEEGVLAESGFSFEARAAVGAGEQASRQRHRVADGEGRVVRGRTEELLPEALLDLPEVGRLPGAKVVRWTSPRVGNHSP